MPWLRGLWQSTIIKRGCISTHCQRVLINARSMGGGKAMATDTAVSLKPLADRLLVEPLEVEEKTASGIVLPDTAKEKPQQGKVIAVGPGRVKENGERLAMSVQAGDTVLFATYAGTEVKISGTKYLIMSESDVLAIVEA